jgi:hypothetical protein
VSAIAGERAAAGSVLAAAPPCMPIPLVRVLKKGCWQGPVLSPRLTLIRREFVVATTPQPGSSFMRYIGSQPQVHERSAR